MTERITEENLQGKELKRFKNGLETGLFIWWISMILQNERVDSDQDLGTS